MLPQEVRPGEVSSRRCRAAWTWARPRANEAVSVTAEATEWIRPTARNRVLHGARALPGAAALEEPRQREIREPPRDEASPLRAGRASTVRRESSRMPKRPTACPRRRRRTTPQRWADVADGTGSRACFTSSTPGARPATVWSGLLNDRHAPRRRIRQAVLRTRNAGILPAGCPTAPNSSSRPEEDRGANRAEAEPGPTRRSPSTKRR